MGHRTAGEGHRVLVVAPYGRDAESTVGLLRGEGYDAHVAADLDAVAAGIDEQLGVVLLTQEAMSGSAARLRDALGRQPPWSDVPFILLAARQAGTRGTFEHLRAQLLEFTANAIVLERPLGLASLVSAAATAMRARQRQFEMRDRLAELEAGRRAIAASERELRLIADSLPVLVGFVDRTLTYRFANRAFEDWIYRPAREVIGQTVRELVGPAMAAQREPDMARALAGEAVRAEYAWPHRDGRRRDAEVRYLPRRNAAGDVDGFYIFAMDVTERTAAAEQLSAAVAERTAALEAEMAARGQAEAALRQSSKMEAVGQLTGGIAHDFNNMLTGVIGAMDIIKRRVAAGRTDDLTRFLDAASSSAERAAALTARLLAFSRRQSLDSRPIDVNRLLDSLGDLLRRTLGEHVVLDIVPGADVPPAVADANQLENAVLNLAINARDAMPGGGRLVIESRVVTLDAHYAAARPDVAPGTYVVVAVTDTGTGMTPELIEKVFDPFFTTKPIGQGTGLGLSMVYGFAQQSGGQVRIHSVPGEGTTVSIFLRAGEAVAAAAPARAAAPQGDGQRVLLVEDDPSVRLLVREVLDELGYRTAEAEEATAAIALLRSDAAFDLMVSDVGLPGMNGRQLAEEARRHRPDLPILFVTGYAENAASRADFLGPGMAMITKPFAMEDLAGAVRNMLA